MSKIVADIVLYKEESNYKSITEEENNDCFVENSLVNIKKMNALKTLLGIENGHLKGTLWSGGYCGLNIKKKILIKIIIFRK